MERDTYGTTTIQCTHCGKDTVMTATKLCDACWEIVHRISHIETMVRESEGFSEIIISILENSGRVAHVVRTGDSISQPIIFIGDHHTGSEFMDVEQLRAWGEMVSAND